jgi:hypothetical protein
MAKLRKPNAALKPLVKWLDESICETIPGLQCVVPGWK